MTACPYTIGGNGIDLILTKWGLVKNLCDNFLYNHNGLAPTRRQAITKNADLLTIGPSRIQE